MGLLSWMRRKRRQSERLLFRYHNGQSRTAADPYLLWRQILNHPNIDIRRFEAALNGGKEPECSNTLQALCEIFGLTRYDPRTGAGLTDVEMLDVLGDFSDYLDTVKKNIAPGPISPLPGESWSSISLEPQDETTSASSDSPSTPPEPSAASVTG